MKACINLTASAGGLNHEQTIAGIFALDDCCLKNKGHFQKKMLCAEEIITMRANGTYYFQLVICVQLPVFLGTVL